MLPRRKPHTQGRCKRYFVDTVITRASTNHGIKPSFGTVTFNLFRAFGSRSKPALVRMMTRAIFLQRRQQWRNRVIRGHSIGRIRLPRKKYLPEKGEKLLLNARAENFFFFAKVGRSKTRSVHHSWPTHIFKFDITFEEVNQLLCEGGKIEKEVNDARPFLQFVRLPRPRKSERRDESSRIRRAPASLRWKFRYGRSLKPSVVSNLRKPV